MAEILSLNNNVVNHLRYQVLLQYSTQNVEC